MKVEAIGVFLEQIHVRPLPPVADPLASVGPCRRLSFLDTSPESLEVGHVFIFPDLSIVTYSNHVELRCDDAASADSVLGRRLFVPFYLLLLLRDYRWIGAEFFGEDGSVAVARRPRDPRPLDARDIGHKVAPVASRNVHDRVALPYVVLGDLLDVDPQPPMRALDFDAALGQ